MTLSRLIAAALALMLTASLGRAAQPNFADIQTVVVIYMENRSFDNLYGTFPGANGLSRAPRTAFLQKDRDGSLLPGLPPIWGGIAKSVMSGAPTAPFSGGLTEAATRAYLGQFNHPYAVGSLYTNRQSGSPDNASALRYTNRDLWHKFYQNQMQIDGGRNDMFAAWADSGGMTMGYFPQHDGDLPLWNWAHRYVLADNFFQAAFGGSYLNHQFLICACAPIIPDNGANPPQPFNPWTGQTTKYNSDGVTAAPDSTAPAPSVVRMDGPWLQTKNNDSALKAPPAFVNDSVITPFVTINGVGHFYSVNTSQAPFPPSVNALKTNPPQQKVDHTKPTTVYPQTQATIGDLLTRRGIDWAYYSGAWHFALTHAAFAAGSSPANPNFQYHHQPFNYFERFDPDRPAGSDGFGHASSDPIYARSGAAEREQHLRDAGVTDPEELSSSHPFPPDADSRFMDDLHHGRLPPVTFYKPHGTINAHSGYANVTDGDRAAAAILTELTKSPQWKHMLVIVTYDEFGGWWDHVAPPKGDYFGPGTRIPALIISPYARRGVIDHTQYDTDSILRFIIRKYRLPTLPGIALRDKALAANHQKPMGDLTNALNLR
ncbi:MAG TPA: acid phosphatase [Rhodopila sp.]|nr:acid phosphatase [Rhodopila sp.]